MKTDDLLDPTNDDLNESENLENEKVENDALNSTEKTEETTNEEKTPEVEEKEESAADLILKKIKEGKSTEEETEKKEIEETIQEKIIEEKPEVEEKEVVVEETVIEEKIEAVEVSEAEIVSLEEPEKQEEKIVETTELVEKKETSEEEPIIEKNAEVVEEPETEVVKAEKTESGNLEVVKQEEKSEETTEVVKEEETSEEEPIIEKNTEVVKAEETSSEKLEVKKQEEKIEELDYTTLSQEELVERLKTLLDRHNIEKIKDHIEGIKIHFYKKHHAEIDEKKKAFIENGGLEEEFSPVSNPLEEQFKAYYAVYKEKRASFNVNLEKQKQENLVIKYQIIDKIGELITGKESLNKTFHDFKDLQKQWQEIGLVPQSEVKKLWDSYNYQIEKFYDYVKINKDLRDLDLKKNMEIKIGLCERAEELLLEPKIVSAFRDLQKLHEQWRETGPVPIDKKDELWERFKQATSKINKKHQEYFENLKKEQVNNLKAKTLLCEKVEEILTLDLNAPKQWEENSKEIIELQRLWKLIGFAPKKDNNKIYDRFRQACDSFFDTKREFYSKNKEVEENNLQIKIDFCNRAESMMDSTDWRKTTDFYIELQKKWKTLGPVPRKHKDEIWHRFRKACNTFFDKKSEHFSSRGDEQDKNLELKRALIEKMKTFELSEDNQANFKTLNQIQKEWTEIGHVPIKFKDEVTKEFRALINEVYDKLDLDDGEKMKLQFRNKIEAFKNSPKSFNRLRNERDKIITRMDKLNSNIVLWENNIGFFAKSKNAESMIKDFEKKIEQAKDSVIELQEQLNVIDDLL